MSPLRRRVVSSRLLVVLVLDVADQLLDQVLQRDDARRTAVLVENDGQVGRAPAHLGQGGQQLRGVRQHQHLAGQVADPDRAGRDRGVEQVADVDEPDDVVGRAVHHRVARVRPLGGELDRLVRRHLRRRRSPPRSAAASARGTAGQPASNTSSTIRRSSSPSDSCAETRSRSSSSDITSRFAFGSPPRARTTRSVDFDSSQITGRAIEAIRSTSGARPSANVSARCSASRLAASSPSTIET